jgi:hypothetical protein
MLLSERDIDDLQRTARRNIHEISGSLKADFVDSFCHTQRAIPSIFCQEAYHNRQFIDNSADKI